MDPENGLLKFNKSEIELGYGPVSPAEDAPALYEQVRSHRDELRRQAQERRADPRVSVRGTALDLAMQAEVLTKTAHDLEKCILHGGGLAVSGELEHKLSALGELDD